MKHIVRQFGAQAKKTKSSGGKGTNKNAYFAKKAETGAKRLPAISKIMRGERGLEGAVDEEDRNEKTERYDKFQSPVGSIKDSVNDKTYDYLYSQNVMPHNRKPFPQGRNQAY